MKFTHKIPTKPGYYWWTNFGEHTPTIVQVTKEYTTGQLYADNGEYSFPIKKIDMKKIIADCKKHDMEPVDGHYYGEQMWSSRIEVPLMDGKKIEADCY
jgi:hypothetical protein